MQAASSPAVRTAKRHRARGIRTFVVGAAAFVSLAFPPPTAAGSSGRPEEVMGHVAMSQGILAGLADMGKATPLDRIVKAVELGVRAEFPGLDLVSGEPTLALSPSETLFALLEDFDTVPTTAQRASIRTLDEMSLPTRAALTRVLEAFAEYRVTAMAAVVSGGPSSPSPWQTFVAARLELLRAGAGMRAVLTDDEGSSDPIQVPPVFSLELEGTDTTYPRGVNYALSIDVGGNDTYRNNAGGSSVATDRCVEILFQAAAALIDISGTDLYKAPNGCGVVGGGHMGAGFLLDGDGADTYDSSAAHRGANGGGSSNGLLEGGGPGTGFLVDARGDDTYRGLGDAMNGGAYESGEGFLLDGEGNDAYWGRGKGVNGGAYMAHGFSLDVSPGARGFLFDGGENDEYAVSGTMNSEGVNGGAGYKGTEPILDLRDNVLGFLLDTEGRDVYLDGGIAFRDCTIVTGGSLIYGPLIQSGNRIDLPNTDLPEQGGCSSKRLPSTPAITGSVPDSPADDNSPYLSVESADTGTIGIFTNDRCAGNPVATAETPGGSTGIQISVADDTTTTFYANITDARGEISFCSHGAGDLPGPFTYVERSSA